MFKTTVEVSNEVFEDVYSTASRDRYKEKRKRKEDRKKREPNEKRNQDNEDRINYVAQESLKALTEAQGHYIIAIQQSDIIFGVGSAGTGKSYIAAMMACEHLMNGKIDKLIFSRPNVESAETMGFLPGNEEEKYEPFIRPFKKILEKKLGESNLKLLIKRKYIEPMPINFIRGETFENCWIVIDEAQNLTFLQLKTILTRLGKNVKIIINGDSDQIDIQKHLSGLEDTVKMFDRFSSEFNEVSSITFTEEDSVRSKLCKKILKAYARYR